jgi:hypothetical protein
MRKKRNMPPQAPGEVPEGATQQASDRTSRPGGPDASPLDDRYGAGTPGGGTEVGGLAGSNYGDGTPDTEELNEAAAGGGMELEADDEDGYSGFSGGAVGGTPAGRRSSGGRVHGGIAPGGVHRGDSTVGSDPDADTK